MNKKELDAQYQEHAQFNLTKLIRRNYEAGSPLPKEYFEGLNFLEESNMVLMLPINAPYGKQHRYDVKESLAENLVALLPLEHYKSYISPTWIVSDKLNDYGPIHRAINDQKYDFLYEILPLCKEYLKSHSDRNKREDNKYIGAYEKGLLEPILNLDSNLNQLKNLKLNQDAYDSYFKLFKEALSHFNDYYEIQYGAIFRTERYRDLGFNDKSWFADYKKMEGVFRKYNREESILETVVTDPKAFDFYKDIFNQFGKSEDNPLFNEELFERAFRYGNKKVVAHLVENKPISSEEVRKTFDTILKDWVESETGKVTSSHDNQLGDSSTYLKALLDMLNKNAPNHKIEDYDLFSHILPASNKKLFDEVMEKYPELKEKKLKDGLTLDQWKYAKEMFNEFLEEQNFTLLKAEDGCNYPSFEMYYMDKLTEHYTPTKELSLDEKLPVNEVVATNFLPLLNTGLNEKSKATVFYTFTLHKQMPENQNESKRLKI
jgi:hypothetical protein